jgi:hypothetical protein
MSLYARNILRIARGLSESDPLLAHELEESVRAIMKTSAARTAVVNPGAKSFFSDVEKAVKQLEDIKSLLAETMRTYGYTSRKELEEFASVFDDAAEAEIAALENSMAHARARITAAVRRASRQAGPMDWLKGLFKGKKKPDADELEHQPSYKVDDAGIDKWLEGDAEWDSAHGVNEELKENKKFFSEVDSVLKLFNDVVKKPTKVSINALVKTVDRVLSLGRKILNPQEAKTPRLAPETAKTPHLEQTVQHYVDLLSKASGNVADTKKYLKELFHAVKADVQDERATLSSRRASARRLAAFVLKNPAHKAEIIPLIYRLNA